jgi:hypothetical protein
VEPRFASGRRDLAASALRDEIRDDGTQSSHSRGLAANQTVFEGTEVDTSVVCRKFNDDMDYVFPLSMLSLTRPQTLCPQSWWHLTPS